MRKRIARSLATLAAVFGRLALRVRGWQPIAGAEDKPDPPAPPEKTFTKAEVEQMIVDRLQRDRKDRKSDDEIAELEKRAKRADELEAANLSQAEKLKADADKAAAERDEAKQAAQAATDRANKTLMRASIISAAAKAGAVDHNAVHALLAAQDFTVTKDGQEIKVTVGDDGQVTGHEDAVTAFLEANQYLVGAPPTPGPGGGGPRPPVAHGLTQEELAIAKSFDMTAEEYAANK
jgi:hypothetical protein